MSVADRRSGGASSASSPKTIALTVAVAVPRTTANNASEATAFNERHEQQNNARAREGRDQDGSEPDRDRRARHPAATRGSPTSAAVPITSPTADAYPGPGPVRPSTRIGMYGRLICVAM